MALPSAAARSPRRQSSLMAQKRMQGQLAQSQANSSDDEELERPNKRLTSTSDKPYALAARVDLAAPPTSSKETKSRKRTGITSSDYNDAAFDDEGESDQGDLEPAKRSRSSKGSNIRASTSNAIALHARLFGLERTATTTKSVPCCEPPFRRHVAEYHRPLLLDGKEGKVGRGALLAWFDSVSASRAMPWRKQWIDPRSVSDAATLRALLERRAYEVWISEIMLQQTRVSVVIDYWNRWMARWPTIHDLAAAEPDDVLSAWRGLGYYSRATRIHEAAKKVVNDIHMRGLLPDTAEALQANVPGVGRYTGGAISAIVFGHAAPMVDGNVLRVMSRQLAVFGNAKTNKAVIDVLWAAADVLVKAVAQDGSNDENTSDRPGRWGQALMELGSTVCTPKPNCSECPISSTCRAYQEGEVLASNDGLIKLERQNVELPPPVTDIEDLCTLCEPFEQYGDVTIDDDDDQKSLPNAASKMERPAVAAKGSARAKQATLSSFAFTRKKEDEKEKKVLDGTSSMLTAAALESIVDHARKFPVKVVKKAVREEETLVCAIERADGSYLLHRRPDKGLLAGLWEFPSQTLPNTNDSTPAVRKKRAKQCVSDLMGGANLHHVGEVGSVPWLFSHLKLTMHVHLFCVRGHDNVAMEQPSSEGSSKQRWVTNAQVEAESMGTGMRKCWALVKEAMR